MTDRVANINRTTGETRIYVSLTLDGVGRTRLDTGLGFLDHMLHALAFHARFDLNLTCAGDLHVDDHHTVEDCALALGQAVHQALGDRRGIARFGHAYAPLDEALCRTVIDLSARPHATINLGFMRDRLGDVATENITHFFISFATAARCTLHVDLIRGQNDHHKAEAAFKATALSLRHAIRREPASHDIPSTKGVL